MATTTCPGCSGEMESQQLDAHYGRTVTIDLCRPCGAFWFDSFESVALTPGSVLKMFAMIADRKQDRPPLSGSPTCPRCRKGLVRTTDLQRGTRFHYWACPADHGRFTPFAEFLREKNFVRPLSGDELEKLRANVKMIHCSSCGAPIDLAQSSICGHCRAPVSILDPAQMEKMVAELKQQEAKRQTVDPMLPMRLMTERLDAEVLFKKLDRRSSWAAGHGPDLLDIGIAAVAELLST